ATSARASAASGRAGDLEHVQDELVPLVIAVGTGIEVHPLPVIDGHAHLRRITEVKVFAAAVVLVAPEVLRVPDVGIVIEPLPVGTAILAAPHAAKSSVLSGRHRSQATEQNHHRHREKHPPDHGLVLWVYRPIGSDSLSSIDQLWRRH